MIANQQQIPIVIKADGLAAGKGVTVAESYTAAEQAVKEILSEFPVFKREDLKKMLIRSASERGKSLEF